LSANLASSYKINSANIFLNFDEFENECFHLYKIWAQLVTSVIKTNALKEFDISYKFYRPV